MTLASVVLLLAGCGGGSDEEPSAAASSDAPTVTWNPCSGLDPDAIGTALGAGLSMDTGTAESMRCALLPTEDGGPALDISYQWFGGTLDEAWDTMEVEGDVTSPSIEGADGARMVVSTADDSVAVTGFVQVGSLIEVVNGLVLPPYAPDADGAAATLRDAVVETLTQLVATAPASPEDAESRAAGA